MEERKKRVMWQFVLLDENGKYGVSQGLYEDQIQAQLQCSAYKVVCPAEWTRIEVDE